VARAAGVSIATVSYVLNNGPKPVHPDTRARVLERMRDLNYRPNAVARGLARRRTDAIGVLFGMIEPQIVTNPYAATVLEGILLAASDLGRNVTLLTRPWTGAESCAGACGDRSTDGLLLVAPRMGSDMLPALSALGMPLVVVSGRGTDYGVTSVDIDNRAGAALAAQHLLDLGHRRIAHLLGDAALPPVAKRLEGFRETMAAAGATPPEELILPGRYSVQSGYDRAARLLHSSRPPTAVFAGNDVIALGVLQAASEAGVPVPARLSVVGFDDVPQAALTHPPLTTIRQPLRDIGHLATRMLVRIIEGMGEAPAHIEVPPELILRGTTGPPAA